MVRVRTLDGERTLDRATTRGAAALALAVLCIAFLVAAPAPALAASPHVGGPAFDTCSACHVPHSAATSDNLFRSRGGAPGEVSACLFCHDGTGASSNIKTGEDSFGGSSGHTLESRIDTTAPTDLTNSCSGCHKPHGDPATRPALPATTVNGVAVASRGNAWCLSCHNDGQDWYERIGTYPSLAAPSRDASGYPTAGVFAGASVYNDGARNAHIRIDPSASPSREAGDCLYCHNAHGSASRYDALEATLAPSTAHSVAGDRANGTYAALCFTCHGGGSWETSGAANIKQYVTHEAGDEGPMASGGHRIKSAGGTLPRNAPLPCYDCHNPHGSSRGNKSLLSDALGANFDTRSGAEGVRRFCLSCHVTSDDLGWDSVSGTYAAVPATAAVEGLLRNGGAWGSGPGGGKNWLLLKVTPGHAAGDTSMSCYDCHGDDYGAADSKNVHDPGSYSVALHTATPPTATITILGVGYASQVCADCHDLELGPEHMKDTSSSRTAACGACHPDPRASLAPEWDRGLCAQGDCHTVGSPAPQHAEANADHTAPAASCTVDGCHPAALGLAAIHSTATTTVAGVERTSCDVCHADGVPATNDCETCHAGNPHPDADHSVAGPCTPSGCHATDAIAIHEPGPACSACHTPGTTPSFACRECHEPPHTQTDHGGADVCISCHSTGNLMTVHEDDCTACHPTPAQTTTWNGTCSQAGCHPDYHSGLSLPQGDHPSDHGDGDDCWDCHDGSWFDATCRPCHTWWYERAAPVTTSDARAAYTGTAFIRLTAVDLGQGTDIVGVLGTYYQVDGGPIQTGTGIIIPGPASGTETHTIEFWSTDRHYNAESPHKYAHFRITAGGPDTNPPTGTMVVNNNAAYTNSANVTVNSNVTDAETGVVDMRIDPGTGTYGAWMDYASTRVVTTTASAGTKTIRVQYRDVAGNTLTVTDQIILDTTAPTGTMTVNNNAQYTNTTAITINSNVTDALSGVTEMRYAAGSTYSAWFPYSSAASATLHPTPVGNRAVTVQFRDAAGNVLQLTDPITYDPNPPTGTMVVNNDALATSSTSVTLNSAMSDSQSGVAQMRIDPGTGTFGGWIAYNATYAFTLPGGDGLKTVRGEFRDGAGNVAQKVDTITLNTSGDTTPPTGTIVINGGAAWTNVTAATLTLSASDAGVGVADMRFSNDNITWSAWEGYATSKAWTLPAGAGNKTVYVQYRDGAGNASTGAISDSIGLETTAPTGSVIINGGATWASTTAVTLALSASDTGGSGVSQMRLSNDNSTWTAWETYSTSRSWTLLGGSGARAVYVQYRDGAGNSSSSASDGISLDSAPPTGSITVNAGAAWTTTAAVTLTLSASDTGGSGLSQMRFSNDGSAWSAWEAYATSKAWSLSAGAGAKTVYVQYRDVAGGASASYTDGIGYDPDAPAGTMLVNNGAAIASSMNAFVDSAVSDAVSGVSQMRIDPGTGVYGAWFAYSATTAITLPAGNGVKTVRAEYRDVAGNVLALTDTIQLLVGGGGAQSFNYTGSDQFYTVPAGVTTITVDVYGAEGGEYDGAFGGLGGRVQADIPVSAGQVLTVRVGGAGADSVAGWPNGGAAPHGGGGGGSSSILLGTTIWVEAGGGGGGDHYDTGPSGGDGGAQGWLPGGNETGESDGGAGGGGGWNGGAAYPADTGGADGGTSYIARGVGTLTAGAGSGNGTISITPGPLQTGTITFMWDAPDWGDPWADYYIYDVNNNLVHTKSSSEIPGWTGWYTATVPVDARGYTWHTEWYDPEWDYGTTDGTALIDYPGKNQSFLY